MNIYINKYDMANIISAMEKKISMTGTKRAIS